MSKTIIVPNPDWDKTIIRYHDLPPTVIMPTRATVALPATILYSPDQDPFNLPPVVAGQEDADWVRITADILHGEVAIISQFLNPINYTLNPGDKIGAYEIVRKIGEGTFSKVYKVKHYLRKGFDVVKIINLFAPVAQDKKKVLQRYMYEYQIGQIDSQYVIRSREKGFAYGHPFIVSEMGDGGDLGQQVRKALSIELIDKLAIDVLTGLADIHSFGIIHRDIKPQNIFLRGSRFKIGDFGVATFVDPSHDLNLNDYNIYGTYGYIAPELFEPKGWLNMGPQQDIFSFGCMLFQLLTGYLPFGEITSNQDIEHYNYNSRNGLLRPIRQLRKDVPAYWEDILYRCLQSDRSNRFQSAREALEILQENHQKNTKQDQSPGQALKHYPYDFVFSFSQENRLLAIEIFSYLQNKGFSILLNNDIFGQRDHRNGGNQPEAKYHLILHTREFIAELPHVNTTNYDAFESLILYQAEDLPSSLREKENAIIVDSKANILKIVEGWKKEPLPTSSASVNEGEQTKHEILKHIARNDLPKAITIFLDYLRSSPGNDEVKNSLYLISSRFKALRKERVNGTVSFEEGRQEENRIVFSLNSLVFDYFPD